MNHVRNKGETPAEERIERNVIREREVKPFCSRVEVVWGQLASLFSGGRHRDSLLG